MNRAIPARHLLYLDLQAPTPAAAIAVGDLDTATHIVWHLSGVGIRPDTAMWGTVREAGQVVLELQRVGRDLPAPVRPACIAWLGYTPPVLFESLFAARARAAVPRIAADMRQLLRLRPDGPHVAIEGHSYGGSVAAHFLEALAEHPPRRLWGLRKTSDDVAHLAARCAGRQEPLMDAFVMLGSPGIPTRFGRDPELLGLPVAHVYDAVASSDWIARGGRLIGKLLGNRGPLGSRLPVDALPAQGLLPVTGHNSSHFVPGRSQTLFGYRDAGTRSLRNIARIITGQEPL
nr:alpha/beta hydrolase [Zhihengliuella flava]